MSYGFQVGDNKLLTSLGDEVVDGAHVTHARTMTLGLKQEGLHQVAMVIGSLAWSMCGLGI